MKSKQGTGQERTPENTPRSLMTWAKKSQAAWIKFGFFEQNATSKNRVKIGSGNIGLRSVRVKIDTLGQDQTQVHIPENQEYCQINHYTNFPYFSGL